MNCIYCGDTILPHEISLPINIGDVIHIECSIRMIVGSIGHQIKTCSCYGGDYEDPPGMTKHEAAHLAALMHSFLNKNGDQ
jgi:hypothetical protein